MDLVTEEKIRSIPPKYVLHPQYYSEVLGKEVIRYISGKTPLSWGV